MTRIVHFADSHPAGPPTSWPAFFDKRVVGIFNYHYIRKHRHNQDWVAAAVRHILADPPDLVVCAGDISTSGEPSELTISREILKPLVNHPKFRFLYVPGNHDYYVSDPGCERAMKDAFYFLNGGQFAFDALPLTVRIGPLDICLINECRPRNLFLSIGRIEPETRDFVARWAARRDNGPKILVGHYPLSEERPIARFRHRLYGQKETFALLRDGKIDLSLCGHTHRPYARLNDRGRGEVCCGSITRNAKLARIDYDEKGDIFQYRQIDLTGTL